MKNDKLRGKRGKVALGIHDPLLEHFTEQDREVIRNILKQRIGIAPTSKNPEQQAAEIQSILQEQGLDMNERLDAIVAYLLETYPGFCRDVIAAVLGREGIE